jgi:hypothetical protein
MLEVAAAGIAYIALVWLVWMLMLLVPAVSVSLSVAGFVILGPVALVGRIRTHHWPGWSHRVFAYSLTATAVAVPSLFLLIKVLQE